MTPEERERHIQKTIDAISKNAEEIYDLMHPGMVIEIRMASSMVVSASGPEARKSLYLIRPVSFLQILSK